MAPARPTRSPAGRLVVVEGIDGAGKSTVVEALAARLGAQGLTVTTTREPTDGPAGRAVRQALADPVHDPLSEALLFAADHAQHVARVRGELEAGRWVLSDRYSTSYLAYQGATLARTWPGGALITAREWLDAVLAPFELAPDLVIWLDLPVATALERLGGRTGAREKFERRALLEAVRENYAALARERGFARVDASGVVEATVDACLAHVQALAMGGRRA